MERKLASIRKIDDITPIEGADLIVVAHIGGWKIIVKKEEFKVGDLAVYYEIDSCLIPRPEVEFLRSRCLKVVDGKEVFRIKTMKMRGVVSQGLLLPVILFPEIANPEEGLDVTELLGVIKYEPPEDDGPGAKLGGKREGNFPGFIPKTDEERVQNIGMKRILGREYEISEKCDGSSLTIYFKDGHFGVCSRNFELKEDDTNAFWAIAKKYNLKEQLEKIGRNIALQGELIGPGIQKNKYKLTEHEYRIFKIWDVDNQKMLSSSERYEFVNNQLTGVNQVPIIHFNKIIDNITMEDIINMAEGKSVLNLNTEREGLVFKEINSGFSFKAISNKFLLKWDA